MNEFAIDQGGNVVTAEQDRQLRFLRLLDEAKESVLTVSMDEQDKTSPGFVRGVMGAAHVFYKGLSQGYEPRLDERVLIEGTLMEGIQEGADAFLEAFARMARAEGLSPA